MVLPGPINLLVRQRSPGHVAALSIRIEWSSVLYFAGQPNLHAKYELCISEVEFGGIRAPRSNSAELPKPSGFGTIIPLCEEDTTRLVVFARTVTWWSYSKDQCAHTCFPNLMKYTGVEV